VSGKLKPCPFCGQKPKTANNRAGGLHIFCPNENCVMPEAESAEPADDERVIELWNARIGYQALADMEEK